MAGFALGKPVNAAQSPAPGAADAPGLSLIVQNDAFGQVRLLIPSFGRYEMPSAA